MITDRDLDKVCGRQTYTSQHEDGRYQLHEPTQGKDPDSAQLSTEEVLWPCWKPEMSCCICERDCRRCLNERRRWKKKFFTCVDLIPLRDSDCGQVNDSALNFGIFPAGTSVCLRTMSFCNLFLLVCVITGSVTWNIASHSNSQVPSLNVYSPWTSQPLPEVPKGREFLLRYCSWS